ncbi:MAG: ROK family transcriptional regulator [Anaerolineae bacterium]|nr:ROK family transcriptional regulator [Anaerolineae bacterium]
MQPAQKATRNQIKTHNERLILKSIYDQKQTSRADIARLTKLTRPTVSTIVAGLIDDGLVREVGYGPSDGGKPPTLLSLVDDSRHLIGLDLSGAEFRGTVINLRGQVRQRVTLPTGGQTDDAALALVFQLIDSLVQATTAPLLGIGIGSPGIVDPNRGIVEQAVNLGWQRLPLQTLLADRYRLPIYVANDSHVAAMGEYTFGQGETGRNLVVIKVGRGIGAGLILNGRLFYGDGFGAGEIGHITVVDGGERCTCGQYGCLETVSSSRAIIDQAARLAQTDPRSSLRDMLENPDALTIEAVRHAFEAGDPTLSPIIAEAGRYLGVAVAGLVGLLNIHQILIAGSVARFGPALLEPLSQAVSRRVLPAFAAKTQIQTAGLGPDIVMLGAAALLLTHEVGVV